MEQGVFPFLLGSWAGLPVIDVDGGLGSGVGGPEMNPSSLGEEEADWFGLVKVVEGALTTRGVNGSSGTMVEDEPVAELPLIGEVIVFLLRQPGEVDGRCPGLGPHSSSQFSAVGDNTMGSGKGKSVMISLTNSGLPECEIEPKLGHLPILCRRLNFRFPVVRSMCRRRRGAGGYIL